MKNNESEVRAWPHSEEAEKALLGCVITGGEREQEIGLAWIRDENAFYSDDKKKIWKAFRKLFKSRA